MELTMYEFMFKRTRIQGYLKRWAVKDIGGDVNQTLSFLIFELLGCGWLLISWWEQNYKTRNCRQFDWQVKWVQTEGVPFLHLLIWSRSLKTQLDSKGHRPGEVKGRVWPSNRSDMFNLLTYLANRAGQVNAELGLRTETWNKIIQI